MLSVPERGGPFAAATLNVTVPVPLPPAPEEIVIHGVLLAAVQPQPLPALTLTVRLAPAGSTVSARGDTSKLQPGDCVTVTICPAIVSVPVRVGPVVGAAVTPTLPLPVPPGDASVSHSALLDAVHGQPAPVVTLTV